MVADNFSPGPWAVDRQNDKRTGWKGVSIKAADGTYVANMVMQIRDNEMDNARLIAAAPDLLNALVEVSEHAISDSPAMWGRVSAAIKKAQG